MSAATDPPSPPPTPPTTRPEDLILRLRAAGCVFAEEEAAVLLAGAASPAQLEDMVAARITGVPLEQVVGWAQLGGVRVRLRPGVFIPRRRTELLVRAAAELTGPGAVVLDLCCGTGAIGLAVRAAVGAIELHAADLDPVAAACARENLRGAGTVHQGDLFAPVPGRLRGRIDTLTANVPYVPTAALPTLPAEAREHEPLIALDGGRDGLDLLRRVAEQAPRWLRPGGHLVSESSRAQAEPAARVLAEAGLSSRIIDSPQWESAVLVGTRLGSLL